jgi:hypothetical protein
VAVHQLRRVALWRVCSRGASNQRAGNRSGAGRLGCAHPRREPHGVAAQAAMELDADGRALAAAAVGAGAGEGPRLTGHKRGTAARHGGASETTARATTSRWTAASMRARLQPRLRTTTRRR